jgi:hypothetical protein
VARKRDAKKLKVTETTSQEVNSLSRVVEFWTCNCMYADDKISSARRRFRLPTHRLRGRRQLGDGGGAG